MIHNGPIPAALPTLKPVFPARCKCGLSSLISRPSLLRSSQVRRAAGQGSWLLRYSTAQSPQDTGSYVQVDSSEQTLTLVTRTTVLSDTSIWQNAAVLVDKPPEWTSFDVCNKLRGMLGVKKVGHAGTLDPLATGLLIVCTGQATKVVDTFQAMHKSYSGCLRLGEATPSYDAGTPVSEQLPWEHVTDEQLEAARAQLTGDIMQLAPMYSAIKVKGQKLYEAARRGEHVERQARPAHVSKFAIQRRQHSPQELMYLIHCSKGTYVRTLVDDLGRLAGTCAHVTALRRLQIGAYRVDHAWHLPDLVAALQEHPPPRPESRSRRR